MAIVKKRSAQASDSPKRTIEIIRNTLFIVVIMLMMYGLTYTGMNNFILFHALLELFSIIIAFTVFFISINTYDISKNHYFMFVGMAYGFVGGFDLLHTFTYKGMNIFSETGADLPTQLWIVARYIESSSLLFANIYFFRKQEPRKIFSIYASVTVLLLLAIFYWGIFPNCYIEGVGLTAFKKVSEYIISILLIVTLSLMVINKRNVHEDISWFLILSIVLTIMSEILFTFYISVYDLSNVLGHILKVVSFYLIYKALVKTSLKEPHKLMYYKMNRTKGELIKRNSALKESEERFRNLIEFSPDAIVILDEEEIVFTNEVFLKLLGVSSLASVKGRNVMDMIHSDYHEVIRTQHRAFKNGTLNGIKDFKVVNDVGDVLDVEVSLTRLIYKNKLSTYAVVRDVTRKKRELNRAALIQRKKMDQAIPLPDAIRFNKIYMPYFAVGGDFFIFHQIDNHSFVGLLGDVTGKGITAALENSAARVLFREAIAITTNPYKILDYINKEVKNHLDDDYVAAFCFKFDFLSKKLTLCSAGINEYIYVPNNGTYDKRINVGPFLGMLDESPFEQQTIDFNKGDRFFFHTDGFETLFENEDFLKTCFKQDTLEDQMTYMKASLLSSEGSRHDDSTCLGLEIK